MDPAAHLDYAAPAPRGRKHSLLRWLRRLVIGFAATVILIIVLVTVFIAPSLRRLSREVEKAEAHEQVIEAAISGDSRFENVEVNVDSGGILIVHASVDGDGDAAILKQLEAGTSPPV